LADTLSPFPVYVAFPRSQYYGDAAPPAPFGWHRTYPGFSAWRAENSGMSNGRFPRSLMSQ